MRAFRGVFMVGGIIVGLLILGIALGTLRLNTYIRSAAFKSEVETRAAQTLGGPVQIQSIDFNIFHGVQLQGFVAQIDSGHSGGQGALKVQVAGVNCTYSWSELLQRRLRLTGITLDQPEIILTRQPTAPLAPPPLAPMANPAASIPSGPLTPGPTSGSTPERGTALPFQFTLDQAKVTDGTVSVRDAGGVSMVDLNGIKADANTSAYSDGEVTGTVRVSDIVLPSDVHITEFRAPVTYRAGRLAVKPFAASIFGGNLAGDYNLGGADGSLLNLNAQGVDLAELTRTVPSGSSARLSGSLDVQSKWRGVETGVANGEGEAQVSHGKLEGVKLLHDLAQVLRVKELDSPVITKAQTHFLVQNRQTQFTGLQIDSDGFQMTGSGVIDFDGNLNADMVLILSRDSMGKLPKEAATFFIQQPDGSGSIAYHLSGTVANPQTDLVTRLFMQNMQMQNAVKKALNKFFH